ncbi:MAG: retroviral-like aspartic protease family protein [Bacteroidales bacterium]|nr:retroviral-like aspartic protease family protein [Bacteroidales bacterium]
MKKALLIAVIAIFMSLQMCYAQKNQVSDYNLRKAYELFDQNDFDGSIKYVNMQLEETPKLSEAYLLRAHIYYLQDKYGFALTDLNMSIKNWNKKEDIQKSTLYWSRARVYVDLNELDKAIDDYSITYKMLLKEKNTELIHTVLYERAEIFYYMGDVEKADADYDLMLKHDETDQVAMIGLARNMINRGEYDKAIEMCNKCEKYDNTYEAIYSFRMQAYDKMGKTDLAIDDAILYIYYSENPVYYEYILKKHLTYSLAKVNKMINNNDDNYMWKMLRTSIYEWMYDFVKAIEEYNNIEKEYGVSADIYYYKSMCYSEIGDTDHAVAEITKYLEMGNAKDYYGLSQRANYYREAGRYDEAIVDFSQMIEVYPTYAYAYYMRGWCYELKGDDKTAMENYNAGIDVDKEYPYIFLMRGELYNKQGMKELANADFEEILKLDTVAESGSCRQYALHFLGRDDEAIEWMNKVIENDPENSGQYYDKACLFSRMGKTDEAIAALRISLEKGNRSFAHIENDDDMDPIRNHPDFIALIKEYKDKPIATINGDNDKQDEISNISEIPMKKMYSGVYEVECSVNGLPLKFTFDTGASIVTISSVEANFMLKNGYLTSDDIKGKQHYSTATGDIHEGTTIRLREIKIGDAILKNVEATVIDKQQAPLLLGQSVLERFGTITIDNINSKLIIKQ